MASATDKVHGRIHVYSCSSCREVIRKITRSPSDTGTPLFMDANRMVYVTDKNGVPKSLVFLPISSQLVPWEIFTKSSGGVGTRTVLDPNEAEQEHLAICPFKTSAIAKEILSGGSKSDHKTN